MNTLIRWILFLAGVVVLILCVHYFLVPLWTSYPMIGWGSRHFRPRMFSWGPVVGLIAILAGGIVWYKLLFPSSGSQSKEEDDLCPYCGQKLTQGEPDSNKPPEPLRAQRGLKIEERSHVNPEVGI